MNFSNDFISAYDSALPRYERIWRALRDSVLNGDFSVGDRLPTQKELAEQYGVSTPTVVRVLSDLKREGLIESIQGKGTFVRCVSISSGTVGLLFTESPATFRESPFALALIETVEKEIRGKGFRTVFSFFPPQMTSEDDARRCLAGLQEKGVIVFVFGMTPSLQVLLSFLRDHKIPSVILRQELEDHWFDTVTGDDVEGMRSAVAYLASRGHSRIAYGDIAMPFPVFAVGARRQGYLLGMEQIPGARPEIIQVRHDPGQAPVSKIWAAFEGPLSRNAESRPTALLCFNDGAASQVLPVLSDAHIRVPQDISLMGYDDLPLCKQLAPPLTTMHTPIDEMSRVAVQMLCDRLMMPHLEPRRVRLPVYVVERDSVSEPATGAGKMSLAEAG